MNLEQESKFPLADSLALAKVLDNQGQLHTPWHLECNMVYDRHQKLAGKGKLLRLRQAAGKTILTVKTPVQTPTISGVKSRQEFECQVACWTQMDQILRALDYTPRLRYEKFRSTWILASAVVCLDILPFGHFAEIEGTPSVISSTAQALGLDPDLALSASYHDLHQQWLKNNNLPLADDILFSDKETTRLAHILGCAPSEEKTC